MEKKVICSKSIADHLLGNSLFQLAALVSLSKEYGYKIEIPKKYSFAKFMDIPSDWLVDSASSYSLYNEPKFSYSKITLTDSTEIDGYFQSEKYFKEYEDDIKKVMTLKPEHKDILTSKLPSNGNKNVSLHIRRGDYLRLQHIHPIMSMDYFVNGINHIKNELGGDVNLIIFSDDITWCKENFTNLNDDLLFVEGQNDYDDLFMMSYCDHNIISNSSFSWWGAWLNPNPTKVVIAPTKWFGPTITHNTNDLIPMTWVKL